MEMEKLSLRFRREEDLVTRRIAGETIIVPVRAMVGDLDSIFTLNETSSAIWELLDGRRDVGQIADALCLKFEVTREEAVEDVSEFLESLKAESLIRPVAEAGSGGPS